MNGPFVSDGRALQLCLVLTSPALCDRVVGAAIAFAFAERAA